MAQEFQTIPPMETPTRRSNTGLLIGLIAILVLCCVCVVFPLIFYFWLGDLLIEFFSNVTSQGGFALVGLLV